MSQSPTDLLETEQVVFERLPHAIRGRSTAVSTLEAAMQRRFPHNYTQIHEADRALGDAARVILTHLAQLPPDVPNGADLIRRVLALCDALLDFASGWASRDRALAERLTIPGASDGGTV